MIRFWGLMLWDGMVMGSSGSAGHCPFWYEGRENTNDRTLPHIQQGVSTAGSTAGSTTAARPAQYWMDMILLATVVVCIVGSEVCTPTRGF